MDPRNLRRSPRLNPTLQVEETSSRVPKTQPRSTDRRSPRLNAAPQVEERSNRVGGGDNTMTTNPKGKKMEQFRRNRAGEFDGGRDRRKSEPPRIHVALHRDQEFLCAGLRYPSGAYASCLNIPTDLDHIIELRHGGLNEYKNYQMLCGSCHNTKTIGNRTEQCFF